MIPKLELNAFRVSNQSPSEAECHLTLLRERLAEQSGPSRTPVTEKEAPEWFSLTRVLE